MRRETEGRRGWDEGGRQMVGERGMKRQTEGRR